MLMICKIEIANYRFLFCKSCEHISISQITDFHFVSFRFVSQITVNSTGCKWWFSGDDVGSYFYDTRLSFGA